MQINVEHQAKDLIVDRQKLYIDGLKTELKNAKIVMQNRKLRMKLYEKLDDYMKDHHNTANTVNTAVEHQKVKAKSNVQTRTASS